MIDLSIIIVNYNTKDLTLRLLESITKNTENENYEIIIVDNHSNDGSVKEFSLKYPQLIILENPQNLGFAAAVNAGIRIAKGKYLLLANPDIEFTPKSIDKMLYFLELNPTVAMLGPKILNPDGSVQLSGKKLPNLSSAIFISFGLHRIFPHNSISKEYYLAEEGNLQKEVDQLMAACLMVRKEIVEKIGWLDERFFLYCEDVDWCKRAVEAGYKIVYFPEVEVIHQKGGSSRKESYRGIIEHHKSLKFYWRKHYAQKYPGFINFLVYSGITLRKALHLVINFMSKEKKVRY